MSLRQFAPVLLSVLVSIAAAQSASVYLSVEAGTTVSDEQGQPVRDSIAGEVMKWVADHGGRVELSSAVKNLAGGYVDRAKTSPATAEEYLAWRTNPTALQTQAILSTERGRRLAVPKEKIAEWLEKEKSTTPVPVVWKSAVEDPKESPKVPVVGWLNIGKNCTADAVCTTPDGRIVMMGSADTFEISGETTYWNNAATDSPGIFIIVLSPPYNKVDKAIWASANDLGKPVSLRSEAGGSLTFVTPTIARALTPSPVSQAPAYFVRLDSSLKQISNVYPLDAINRLPVSALTDQLNRPVFLYGSPDRHGEGALLRLFENGQAERSWNDWQDGSRDIIKLDFSSPFLAGGPFALWAKGGGVYPDFPTPIGNWGAESNAGQPMVWTNVKNGGNPISGADLKPEALVIDKEGNAIVAGTIPFEMGFPDFDPFLMSFSPEGKLRWTNCFLNGLLSEPDQKTQALEVDPSSGDILVCYWQHGNNQKTLLLDPNGWLNKFTGTNGNIKISWIGRVDAESGKLKNSTYIYSQMPNAKNPRWPDLNSSGVNAMGVADGGRVYAAGSTTISFPTTSNAFLPGVTEYGGHPMLVVLRPDLSAPHYSTYLSAGQGGVDHIAILPGGAAFCAGRHSTEGTALPVTSAKSLPLLSESPPSGQKNAVFLAIIPIPADEADWSFNN